MSSLVYNLTANIRGLWITIVLLTWLTEQFAYQRKMQINSRIKLKYPEKPCM